MDRELPDVQRQEIQRLVAAHPQVRGLHDLRTRRAGTDIFIQLHLELDDELDLLRAHRIADEVEELLMAAFPASDVIIHIDPLSVVEQEPRQTF